MWLQFQCVTITSDKDVVNITGESPTSHFSECSMLPKSTVKYVLAGFKWQEKEEVNGAQWEIEHYKCQGEHQRKQNSWKRMSGN